MPTRGHKAQSATKSTLNVVSFVAFAIVACAIASCGKISSGDGDPVVVDASIADAAVDVCAKTPCDIFEQCGCDVPQVCDLDLDGLPAGDTECRDLDARGRELDRCTRLEECDEGYLCGGRGQCLRYCEDEDDCVTEKSRCLGLVGNGEGGTVPGVMTCSKPCNPVGAANNNCPSDFACRIFAGNVGEADQFNYSQCVLGGPGDRGVDCSANGNNDCQAGFICVTFGDQGSECRQSCGVGQPSPCALDNEVCREFGGTPPELDDVEYGFCGIPPAPINAPLSN